MDMTLMKRVAYLMRFDLEALELTVVVLSRLIAGDDMPLQELLCARCQMGPWTQFWTADSAALMVLEPMVEQLISLDK